MAHFVCIALTNMTTVFLVQRVLGLPLWLWHVPLLYVFSMLVYPWIEGGLNWRHVQDIWDRWQSLNAAVLAFVASVIVFLSSRNNANEQRKRDFLASKAFLPSALSELNGYMKSCSGVYCKAWNGDVEPGIYQLEAPELPEEYREVFSNCIRYAEPEVGDYLCGFLYNLQINNSRMKQYVGLLNANGDYRNKPNLVVYLYRLGELQALLNRLFPFARGYGDLESRKLDWKDFENAYSNLGIVVDDFVVTDEIDLRGFTERRISKSHLET